MNDNDSFMNDKIFYGSSEIFKGISNTYFIFKFGQFFSNLRQIDGTAARGVLQPFVVSDKYDSCITFEKFDL